jgi:drug/metabolite transporter (DMT)-like permease
VVLLFSLRATPAATASLLLNFEGVATTLIAALAFHEAIGRRAWWAIGLITLAGVALSVRLDGAWGLSPGAAGVMLACVLWGVDNNLTANISAKDPLAIVTAKGLGAGGVSLALALLLRQTLPPAPVAVAGMALGAISYGLSIVLFIHALRGLGAARTSALYSTAPLAGVALSLLLFRELPPWTLLLALPLMVVGTLLLASEHHAHRHFHAALPPDHAHTHGDDHHDHDHPGGGPRTHAHLHSHSEGTHDHAHLPDLHHRHVHRIDP